MSVLVAVGCTVVQNPFTLVIKIPMSPLTFGGKFEDPKIQTKISMTYGRHHILIATRGKTTMIPPLFTFIPSECLGCQRSERIHDRGNRHHPYLHHHPSLLSPQRFLQLSSWTKLRLQGAHGGYCQCEGSQRQDSSDTQEQCAVCMYTGVTVCTGLSLYFVKLATEETTLPKNQRFLWACSAGWAVAGMYRWYLG